MTHHPSFPCTLGVDWHGGTSYAGIGQVRDIEGPTIEREEIEVAPHHELADNYKLYFPGVSDAGELTFPVNLDPNSAAHVGAEGTGLLGSFEKVYNGTSLPAWEFMNKGMDGGTATWTFKGFPTAFDFNMGEVEGYQEGEITVKLSGKPTLTIT